MSDSSAQLRQIWADVLEMPDVPDDLNFFDVGGHSLSATRLVARVRAVANVDVPLRLLFDSPTFGAFSASIEYLIAEQRALRELHR